MGGLYRDQGAEVVSEWLISLLQPHIEDAYRRVRENHLLPASIPSLFSSTSSEVAGSALPSYLAGGPRDRRLTALQASVPQRSTAQVGDGAGSRRAATDIPRQRRRSSPGDSENGGPSGKQGMFSPRRGLLSNDNSEQTRHT